MLSAPQGTDYLVEVDGAVHRISGGEAGWSARPRRRWSWRSRSRPGDEVAAGDVVAVVESMKLETALRAPVAGRVREVLVAANTQVEGGTKLLRLEPARRRRRGPSGRRARVAGRAARHGAGRGAPTSATAAADALDRAALPRARLRHRRGATPARCCRALSAARPDLPADDPDVLAGELAIMQIFADLSRAVAQPARARGRGAQPTVDPAGDAEAAHNPQEYLYAYLRSRDADAEGLPESFRAKLRAALAHYGVRRPGAVRRRALASALYRMFLAHRRAAAHVPVLLDLLQLAAAPRAELAARRRPRATTCGCSTTWSPPPSCATRWSATSPGGCATAASTRRDRRRAGAGPAAGARRAGPARPTDPAARAAQIDDIVAAGRADPRRCSASAHHAAMLEVMTRRYYRIRHLTDVQVVDRGGRPLLRPPTATTGATTSCSRPPCTPRRRRRSRGEPPAVQADLRRIVAQLPAGPHRAARPLRHRGPRRPTTTRSARAEKIRESAGHACPRRWTGSRSRCAGPAADERLRAGSPSAPRRRTGAAGRGPHAARAAPDGGRAAGAVAAVRTSS